jgi:hypothetical protein
MDRAAIIAEYEAAVAREREAREHAFLADLAPYVVKTERGNVALRVLTVRDMAVLFNIDDTCINDVSMADSAEVLRCVVYLDAHRPKGHVRRYMREKRLAGLTDLHLRIGLKKYFDDMFIDAPPSEGRKPGRPYYSWEAGIVHRLASAYGWSRNEIMDTPVPVAFQLMKIMRAETMPDAPMFNASDKILNKLTLAAA